MVLLKLEHIMLKGRLIKMNKNYIKPDIQVVEFSADDIITLSIAGGETGGQGNSGNIGSTGWGEL